MISIRSYFMAKFYDATMTKVEDLCFRAFRADLLAQTNGAVLEIGAGTGLNLEHYPDAVETLILSEPNDDMRAMLDAHVNTTDRAGLSVTSDSARHLSVADDSLDGVVSTLVLCSVPDQAQSLEEIVRVLRPGGCFYFIEHVGAAQEQVWLRRWQRWFDPFWAYCCGGCQLTRDTEAAIAAAGLTMERVEHTLMRGAPAVVRPLIVGVARKAK